MNRWQAFWAYVSYIARHKWYVWQEGRKLRWPCGRLQLFWHDWSKLTPSEFWPYAKHFYMRTPHAKRKEDPDFDRAWLAHVHRNRHHWDHWVLRVGKKVTALRVPEKYLRECAADWLAMARQRGAEPTDWYARNRDSIHMHPASRMRIEVLIGYSEEQPEVAETGEIVVGVG